MTFSYERERARLNPTLPEPCFSAALHAFQPGRGRECCDGLLLLRQAFQLKKNSGSGEKKKNALGNFVVLCLYLVAEKHEVFWVGSQVSQPTPVLKKKKKKQ